MPEPRTLDPLLVLHGALGSREQFEPLCAALSPQAEVHALNFPGHGRESGPVTALSVRILADEVLAWMNAREIVRARILGYSMGGYVGLLLARHQPSRITCVATFATKFRWSPAEAAKEIALLDPAAIRAKVPAYATTLAARHGADRWEDLVRATATLVRGLGERPALDTEDLRQIGQPVLVGVGDRDATVTIDETAEAARALPNGSFLVLPGTPHPIEKAPLGLLAAALRGFLENA
jgi:pimeloyl-ACP methyl ester carboxylesterase